MNTAIEVLVNRQVMVDELENFQDITRYFQPSPGDVPSLDGIDVYGQSLPLNGVIGGDHIIYVDFKKRYDLEARIESARREENHEKVEALLAGYQKAGIVLADVSGHRLTDALVAVMLHQAFLLGSIYEMDQFGQITTRLFENINTRFVRSSSVRRFLTMLYGEITSEGKFRFISAAHPAPIVFSRLRDKIVRIKEDRLITFPPIGTLPLKSDIDHKGANSVLGYKDQYSVNEISLMGDGDIMVLYTDGLSELREGSTAFLPDILESRLRELRDLSAEEICQALMEQVRALPRDDDVSLVVIKRQLGK